MENTRRSFLKKMTAAGIGTAGLALSSNAAATVTTETSAEKKKKPAGKDDGKLRFGFIGTGSRCHEHINNVLSIPGNKIVAICDIQAGPIQRARCIIDNCVHPDYRPLLNEYLEMGIKGQTPQNLKCCFAFHEEFAKSGDMHNVKWEEYNK